MGLPQHDPEANVELHFFRRRGTEWARGSIPSTLIRPCRDCSVEAPILVPSDQVARHPKTILRTCGLVLPESPSDGGPRRLVARLGKGVHVVAKTPSFWRCCLCGLNLMLHEAGLYLAGNGTHSGVVCFQHALGDKERSVSERTLNGFKQARNVLKFDDLIRLS